MNQSLKGVFFTRNTPVFGPPQSSVMTKSNAGSTRSSSRCVKSMMSVSASINRR